MVPQRVAGDGQIAAKSAMTPSRGRAINDAPEGIAWFRLIYAISRGYSMHRRTSHIAVPLHRQVWIKDSPAQSLELQRQPLELPPAPHSLSLPGTLTAGHTCMRPRAATHRACFSYTYLSRFPLMTRKVCRTIKRQSHQISIARASFALACAARCAAAHRSEMDAGDESQPRAANASSPFERASRRALVDVCVLFQFLGN